MISQKRIARMQRAILRALFNRLNGAVTPRAPFHIQSWGDTAIRGTLSNGRRFTGEWRDGTVAHISTYTADGALSDQFQYPRASDLLNAAIHADDFMMSLGA